MDFPDRNNYNTNNGVTDRDYLAPNRHTDQIKHLNQVRSNENSFYDSISGKQGRVTQAQKISY